MFQGTEIRWESTRHLNDAGAILYILICIIHKNIILEITIVISCFDIFQVIHLMLELIRNTNPLYSHKNTSL